jgi:predicted TIM-barrel fold metal-dependent hydrolase
MADPKWRAGLGISRGSALRFDLQTPWWHCTRRARLAAISRTRASSSTTPACRPTARRGICRLARAALAASRNAPNAAIKISGLGVRGDTLDRCGANRAIVLTADEHFWGSSAAMFASNFPGRQSFARAFATI